MATIADVLAARQETHGDFSEHAETAQCLKSIMHSSKNWADLSPVYKEGIDMICHKLARIATGSPYHRDHVVDIQGYAKLMEGKESA